MNEEPVAPTVLQMVDA